MTAPLRRSARLQSKARAEPQSTCLPTKRNSKAKEAARPTSPPPAEAQQRDQPSTSISTPDEPTSNPCNNGFEEPEERLLPWVPEPSTKVRQRIARAQEQRMFMVEREELGDGGYKFAILGSTGNVYTVQIDRRPRCSCIDYRYSRFCKHILFVMIKVLRLPPDNPLVYQRAWLRSELAQILANMAPDPAAVASKQIQQEYRRLAAPDRQPVDPPTDNAAVPKPDDALVSAMGIRRRMLVSMALDSNETEADDDLCPICYDIMTPEQWRNQELLWCQRGCGNNVHLVCFEQWREHYRGQKAVTCIYCRTDWEVSQPKKMKKATAKQNVGYINLEHLVS
ncbi:hypothetical protein H4R34_004413 [Dimargaris verticillata]|uniref:SWIM-type domain-containing protein n=1 Tax=Dimargaris verticillata TaxID=2761393 RepID=A0A9W8B080_9FUNG|nr:hypothetical protein H4R34_004413 [Dimargaris verticillata]